MTLRPMTMNDADKMLEWKNYPETIQHSIETFEPIKKEDHYKWLEKNIQYFQIIYSGEHTYGAVRVQDNEISIWIDRKYWGSRIATFIIDQVCEEEKEWIAKITVDNIASMKSFIRAGFEPDKLIECGKYSGPYYIFKK